MKTKTLVAIVFAAISITLISCDWLFGKKAFDSKAKSIVGKWAIENITDSSKNDKNGIGLLALAVLDSTPFTIEFRPDSSFRLSQNNKPLQDSGKYYLSSAIQTLYIEEGSSSLPLNIKSWTDSSLELFSDKDSIWYSLRKQ